MRTSTLFVLAATAALTAAVRVRPLPKGDPHGWSGTNATFDQLIDHSNPALGTFKQFYYYDTTYCDGPGCPVVLFTPGEINVTGYTNYLVTNRTTGVVAREIGAATVVIEHRYWGTSTPFVCSIPYRENGRISLLI